MAAALHGQGLEVWLCVPVGNDIKVYDLDTLANSVDRFLWPCSMMKTVKGTRPGRLLHRSGLRSGSASWLNTEAPANGSSALALMAMTGKPASPRKQSALPIAWSCKSRAGEGPIETQAASYGPHFSYTEQDQSHEVWSVDAVTFYNQKVEAEAKALGGIGLYRLGTEDPAVWKILDGNRSCLPASIETIKGSTTVTHIGEGDFVTATNERADGTRPIAVDAAGRWNARYIRYPQYPLLNDQGQSSPGQVALTFDDGPDPEWTPRILDILKAKDVKAVFFVVGSNAERYPDLVRK